MVGRAIKTEIYSKRHRRPCGILLSTVKAYLGSKTSSALRYQWRSALIFLPDLQAWFSTSQISSATVTSRPWLPYLQIFAKRWDALWNMEFWKRWSDGGRSCDFSFLLVIGSGTHCDWKYACAILGLAQFCPKPSFTKLSSGFKIKSFEACSWLLHAFWLNMISIRRTSCRFNFPTPLQPLLGTRLYATQTGLGTTGASPRPRRKAVTAFNDDGRVAWGDLTPREKAARTTQQTFNFGLILVGAALTVCSKSRAAAFANSR